MSWKSFVTAGLLCVVASPVLANPTLTVVNGPALNAQGNWVWTVSVTEAYTGGDGMSPVAVELGFDANRNIVSITKGTEFDGTNTSNPGNQIFGWEDLTNLGGSGACNSGNPGNCPVGLLYATAAGGTDANAPADQAFAALGSETANGFQGTQTLLTIVTTGPQDGAETGNLQVLGSYAGNSGRIAEMAQVSINGGPTVQSSLNFNGYADTAIRTVRAGDIDMDGTTGPADASAFGFAWNQPSTSGWAGGDFNRDGTVGPADASYFGTGWNGSSGVTDNISDTGVAVLPAGWAIVGSGGGSGSAVPEPASAALVALALMGGLGLARRRS